MTNDARQSGMVRQVRAGAVPSATVAGVVIAVLFGAFLVMATGLAGGQALHNAAHDARHGLAFPCH